MAIGKTKTQMRQLIAKQFPLPLIAATSDGSSTTSTLIDASELGSYADNHFIGGHLYLSSGSPSARDLRVTDSDQSSKSVTFIPIIGAAPNTLAYEILPFSSIAIEQALDEAIKEAYDKEWIVRSIHHTIFPGSPIYNASADFWTSSSALDGWTVDTISVARTLATTVSTPFNQMYVASLSTAVGHMDLNKEYRGALSDFAGSGPALRALMWADTGSSATASLLVDGSVFATTAAHPGDSQWHMVSATTIDISDNLSEIGVRVARSNGSGVVYFAGAWLEGGPPVYDYPFPIDLMQHGPDAVYRTRMEVGENEGYIDFSSRRLRSIKDWRIQVNSATAAATEFGVLHTDHAMSGPGRLYLPGSVQPSLPQSGQAGDSEIIEIREPDDVLLAKMAALKLVEKGARGRNNQNEQIFMAKLEHEIQVAAEGRGRFGPQVAPLSPDL